MVKALPTNPQKWLMLDVSELRNGRWYINFALFSTSLGTALKLQENDARANVWGFKRSAVYVMGNANKRGRAYTFYIYFLLH